ncbi:cupredoxin family copper-binding protein [Methylopila henanensis]|uniref:Cupredoxin family copper-binding protein n=1 Tax=Methylopila henanensis TaxID=873516 RepID=A0ABW4KBK0_9HYPH
MRTALLAALCVALPVSFAYAEEPIEIVEGGAASANAVSIERMSFATPEIKIKVGDSVTWTNNDDIAHNVHFRQGPAKGNPKAQGKMLSKGETYTVKFGVAGEYSYLCTPHPMMKGKVIVE